jgi:hypothetical protein
MKSKSPAVACSLPGLPRKEMFGHLATDETVALGSLVLSSPDLAELVGDLLAVDLLNTHFAVVALAPAARSFSDSRLGPLVILGIFVLHLIGAFVFDSDE